MKIPRLYFDTSVFGGVYVIEFIEITKEVNQLAEKYIQESLNTLIHNKHKTVIAIAHRLSTLKHMDRILVLEKGRIIEEGSHQQLIRHKNSLYKKLWELQEI